VTLPLTTPGYVSGALLVFIWTFADFVTPLVVGVQDLLAVQAYLNIVQFVDRRIFRMGIVISVLLVVLAIVFVLVARQYVAIKDTALSPTRRWSADSWGRSRAGLRWAFSRCSCSRRSSAGRRRPRRGRQGLVAHRAPVHYTLDHFRQVSVETPRFIVNSLLYSGLAVLICLAIGVPMAWIMARTRTPGRGAMDALTTLILAIPGTAIGIAYIRASISRCRGSTWRSPACGSSFRWCSPCAGCRTPCAAPIRRSLLVHKSMEEAAENVGAGKLATFRTSLARSCGRASWSARFFPSSCRSTEASATLFLTWAAGR